MFVISTIKLDPEIESAGDSNFERRFTCIILCVSEWYAPVSFRVLGADVGVRRGIFCQNLLQGLVHSQDCPTGIHILFCFVKTLGEFHIDVGIGGVGAWLFVKLALGPMQLIYFMHMFNPSSMLISAQ